MDTHHTLNDRKNKEFPFICNSPNIVLSVVGDLEEVMLSVYRDFNEYEEVNKQILEFYKSNNYLNPTKDVIGKIFPIDELKTYEFTFHTVLRKVLRITTDREQ